MTPNWKANWIWIAGEAQPRNYRLNLRKQFDAPAGLVSARLHVSADSRYRLYLDGQWLGDGPARSFPQHQQYDTYELGSALLAGPHVLAASVHHYGEETFQYVLGRGAFLCQLELTCADDSVHVIESDESWRVSEDRAHERRTPRISCQMPFEEQFDARNLDGNFLRPGFDDSAWKPAHLVGPVGTEPWVEMAARSIPFFTREERYPVRVLDARHVEPPGMVEGFTLRPYLCPGQRDAEHQTYRGLVCTEIVSPTRQKVRLPRVETVHGVGEYFLNGAPIPRPGEESVDVELDKGPNALVVAMNGGSHYIEFSLAVDAAEPVHLQAPLGLDGKWLVIGPFSKDEEESLQAALASRSADELPAFEKWFQPVQVADEHAADVFNLTWTRRVLPGEPEIEDPDSMLTSSASAATVPPSDSNIEVLLDFGEELVGYTEFDVEAPEGVVVDFNFFEAINDGAIQWTRGNRSSFRYVTRAGRQRFLTSWRRGFRYAAMTLRNVSEPVRIFWVRTIFATYPAVERGDFQCSDEQLNRIWRVGRHTLRCCSEDTYTDCPTYEQTYWVGDGRNEALVDYAAFGNWPLARRCVLLPPQSLYRSALPESQVPSGWTAILTAWSMLWVQMTYEHFLFTGDVETLETAYAGVRKTLEACQEMCENKHGLLSIDAWNMFDWAPTDTQHHLNTHNNLFLAAALDRAAQMAEAVSRPDDAVRWRQFRGEIVDRINQHLWSEERGAYVDSIHDDGEASTTISQPTNTLALLYDAAPPGRIDRVRQVAMQPDEDVVKFGSPFAMFYSLEALVREGRFGDILSIIRDKWGYMLDAGATSFWETFPGFDKENPTRSHCHAWSAAPTYFLSQYQLGVEPLEPGYSRARIAPQPVDLDWARGRMPTPHGEIAVSWRRSADEFRLEVAVPPEVGAEVVLPVSPAEFSRLEVDGKPADEKRVPECATRITAERQGWKIELRAGQDAVIVATLSE